MQQACLKQISCVAFDTCQHAYSIWTSGMQSAAERGVFEKLLQVSQVQQYDTYTLCRVPEQCPQAIADLMLSCQLEQPYKRPTTSEIIQIISDNLPAKVKQAAAKGKKS